MEKQEKTKMDNLTGNTFIISDIHFGHQNLFEKFEPIRQSIASTLSEFESLIVKRWNSVVSKDDVIFVPGDFCINKKDELKTDNNIKNFTRALNGYKILLKGNHDVRPDEFYIKAGWNKVISGEPAYLIQEINGIQILFSHFPMNTNQEWDALDNRYTDYKLKLTELFNQHKCKLNIHGHSHGKVSPDPRLINVSLEQLPDFTPIQINKLLEGKI